MHQVGCPIRVKKILVKSLSKERSIDIDSSVLTTDVNEILSDPEIDVVIEVMGGVEQTKQYLLDALNNKKHVVTANKDLMAIHGAELLTVAAENECDLFFEASVAGWYSNLKKYCRWIMLRIELRRSWGLLMEQRTLF